MIIVRFQISNEIKPEKEKMSKMIQKARDDESLEWEKRIYISLPEVNEHKNHPGVEVTIYVLVLQEQTKN